MVVRNTSPRRRRLWSEYRVQVCHHYHVHFRSMAHVANRAFAWLCLCDWAGGFRDATSLKGSCGNLACLFAFDKILAQLDAVAANGSGPQFSRPTAKTLNALRYEAFRTAEELAFNLSVDLTRPKHGGEADGAETGKVQNVATGAQVADHGVLALTGATGVSNRGAHKLATEILELDCRLAAQAEELARLKKRPETGVGGVAVVGYEELAAALANAVRILEKEAKAIALERAALVDTRNQEALVLGRVDARLGQLQWVVADSMETAQKKLTDEVARKIDNMSTAISATAERAITISGVTDALHTLIALVGGTPPTRTDNDEPAANEIAEPRDTEHGKRAAGAKAENQRGAKRQ
ncbi:unnamed protein product [Closterium sp. Yama58-4]|nr:unnamed protein product [Closterium sp. Yama58-4]